MEVRDVVQPESPQTWMVVVVEHVVALDQRGVAPLLETDGVHLFRGATRGFG